MKAEMINLLHRLNACPEDPLQSLILYSDGSSMAVYPNNALRFKSLDDLERLAYPGDENPTLNPPASRP